MCPPFSHSAIRHPSRAIRHPPSAQPSAQPPTIDTVTFLNARFPSSIPVPLPVSPLPFPFPFRFPVFPPNLSNQPAGTSLFFCLSYLSFLSVSRWQKHALHVRSSEEAQERSRQKMQKNAEQSDRNPIMRDSGPRDTKTTEKERDTIQGERKGRKQREARAEKRLKQVRKGKCVGGDDRQARRKCKKKKQKRKTRTTKDDSQNRQGNKTPRLPFLPLYLVCQVNKIHSHHVTCLPA